jgi:acetyl esterase/lipase
LRRIIPAANIVAMETYRPTADATGSAIVVLPGGGYGGLAAHEGEPVARWLASLGIVAFVCRYRHGPSNPHPAPLDDAAAAVRSVRSQGFARVGILGFSAGGHLAATLSTQPPDQAARPDAAVLCYPLITMSDPHGHAGSHLNLLGPNPSAELVEQLSAERRVTPRTPPTFIFHTADDPVVPVENVLMYAGALRANAVPFELHVYAHGRHGVGLATDDPLLRTWTERCADWLRGRGF